MISLNAQKQKSMNLESLSIKVKSTELSIPSSLEIKKNQALLQLVKSLRINLLKRMEAGWLRIWIQGPKVSIENLGLTFQRNHQ
jgi:hypothetical protein